MASTTSLRRRSERRSSSRLGIDVPDLPKTPPYTLEPGQPTPGSSSLLRHPIAVATGTGILTRFPSATPFDLALGADSPCADLRCAGNLGLPARRTFTPFIVTHVSILTSNTSSRTFVRPSTAYGTLLYRPRTSPRTRSFGYQFSPGISSAQADSTSELLRFL